MAHEASNRVKAARRAGAGGFVSQLAARAQQIRSQAAKPRRAGVDPVTAAKMSAARALALRRR